MKHLNIVFDRVTTMDGLGNILYCGKYAKGSNGCDYTDDGTLSIEAIEDIVKRLYAYEEELESLFLRLYIRNK